MLALKTEKVKCKMSRAKDSKDNALEYSQEIDI